MKQPKEGVSITLDKEIVDEIKKRAEYTGRSFSQYINFILKKHIESQEDIDSPK